ncbi:hypothetical protein F5J12DRAFT_834550 [Pisolithus orientalis]|uniref:uncharacterized protein n=1 Tax=Pisolithus orientalis TaxID=936130 RepID=UPI0022246D11|nr:uncharacterized protein F5J12DRAFT_834550 [Pisolithus orientalis]KAI6005077.1 hypothetical protein F5J12DRAFT_834550 [Pisolithus orientalis]
MLKRQRPVTPPPSSLDFPTYLPDILAKGPLPSPDLTSISESSGKRRRLERPDRETLRGWTLPSSDVSHGEHGDGKEDVERSSHGDGAEGLYDGIPNQSILSPGDGGYKQTNNILHEVHVLNQHRLVFSPSERPPQSHAPEISPHSVHIHPNSQEAAESSYGLPSSAYRKSPVGSNSFQPVHRIPAGQSCSANVADDHADLQEAQAVWEHYGGTNKLLGSLFLSRRRELQGAFYTLES